MPRRAIPRDACALAPSSGCAFISISLAATAVRRLLSALVRTRQKSKAPAKVRGRYIRSKSDEAGEARRGHGSAVPLHWTETQPQIRRRNPGYVPDV